MSSKYFVSRHAWKRIRERFHGIDIDAELAAAVPYIAQYRSYVALKSPCGAVWIISQEGVVVTVKTTEQANAHLPLGLAELVPVNPEAQKRPPAKKKEPAPYFDKRTSEADRIKAEATKKLLPFVERHAREDELSGAYADDTKEKRHAELRAAGFSRLQRNGIYPPLYFAARKKIAEGIKQEQTA